MSQSYADVIGELAMVRDGLLVFTDSPFSTADAYCFIDFLSAAARRHFSFNAVCFSKPPQNLSLFLIISFLTVFGF